MSGSGGSIFEVLQNILEGIGFGNDGDVLTSRGANKFPTMVNVGSSGNAAAPVGFRQKLDEQITVTINTQSVFEPVITGDFISEDVSEGFTFNPATGIITVTFKGTKLCRVLARFSCRAIDNTNVTAAIGLSINGNTPVFQHVSRSNPTTDVNGTWLEIDALVTLSENDTIQLTARNTTNTVDLVLRESAEMRGNGLAAPILSSGFIEILP